jgi:glycosyltransferase involved in cell wall biosynthesis
VKEEQEVKEIVPLATTIVLPNILEIQSPLPRNGQHKNGMQLLFVGRIHPIKNLELLIDALKEMNSNEAYSVKIAGEGETEYVNALKARASGLQNIQWIGEVDGTQKFKLMSESDLLVLLSHSENFGNVVFEALSQGTPVLVSKNTGAGEYVRQHELGWVIDPSVKECQAALKEIAGDTSKREHIRMHAWQTIDSEFNPVRLAERYQRLYQKIAARNHLSL